MFKMARLPALQRSSETPTAMLMLMIGDRKKYIEIVQWGSPNDGDQKGSPKHYISTRCFFFLLDGSPREGAKEFNHIQF